MGKESPTAGAGSTEQLALEQIHALRHQIVAFWDRAVRRQPIDHLRQQFGKLTGELVGVEVSLRTSRMKLVSGMSVSSALPCRSCIGRAALCVALLAGCGGDAPLREASPPRPADVQAQIANLLPVSTPDRVGWAVDIYAALAALEISPSAANICAVLAVTEQESSYRADPAVPRLGQIAWVEIDRRAERLGIPPGAVHLALKLPSSSGKSYAERLDLGNGAIRRALEEGAARHSSAVRSTSACSSWPIDWIASLCRVQCCRASC